MSRSTPIQLELTHSEAIVLEDFLARFEAHPSFRELTFRLSARRNKLSSQAFSDLLECRQRLLIHFAVQTQRQPAQVNEKVRNRFLDDVFCQEATQLGSFDRLA